MLDVGNIQQFEMHNPSQDLCCFRSFSIEPSNLNITWYTSYFWNILGYPSGTRVWLNQDCNELNTNSSRCRSSHTITVPTNSPTLNPSNYPTTIPTTFPTQIPSNSPSLSPSNKKVVAH